MRSVVFQQAENRLHAQKAILLELMQTREGIETPRIPFPELAHV